MKKLLLTFIGIIVLLGAVIVIGPSLVDLRPRIAAAVREATGRELRIDSELQIALLPKLRISASGIHLSNARGATTPEMLSAESVALETELWPLLDRRLVVNSLIVNHPAVNLEVDKTGHPNWEFMPQAKADAPPAQDKPDAAGGPSLAGVRLGEFRVEQGQLTYRNAVSGQEFVAKDATLTAAMAELESPLSLNGRMVLNDELVAADISVDTVAKLQRGQQAGVKVALLATHVTARFDGAAQQRPVPGLDGVFDLDIPSVGKLASWLKAPLETAQPDPGPLKVHAVFAVEGTKSLLKEATVAGTALNATASGSLDAGGDATRLTAIIETGLLDVDRYLPPQAHDKSPPSPAAKARGGQPATAGDPFAGLSDQPFDLTGLRRLDADVKVSIAGIKAMGYEVGRVAFTTTAKAGVLAAKLSEIALYGGTVKGMAKLDAASDALGLDAALKIDRVTVDALARHAAAPVSGIVSASLDATARGRSRRALAEDMRGHLAVDLGGVTVRDAAARAISQLKLDVDLPGADKAPSLKASVVYNGERIDAAASLAPLGQLASGERFPAKLAVDSKLATLRYDGTVQQRPVPGLDGIFDVDVRSVGKLAAWAGQPLDAKQPDPGSIKLHAVLTSDGTRLALKDAVISGKAINATAQATFDRSRKPATFDVKIDLQQANLDAYLPPAPAQTAAKPVPPAQPRQPPPVGWSTELIDLAALGEANGKAEITLAAVRYRGLDITKGAVKLTLAENVLKVTAEKLAFAQGTIDSATILDASGGGAKLDYRVAIAGVQARPLLKAFAGSDRLGGTIEFETAIKGSGRTQQELISSLEGAGHFKVTDGAIYGINLAAALRQAGSLGLGGAQTEKTDFAELSGSYTIKSGIIDNRDLKMLAPVLRLSGSGTVPMPLQTVDYLVEAKLVPSLEGQGGREALAGVPIPIRITGPWSNPSYQPDWSSALQTMAKDPERLKNLPGDLGKAAKEFGVSLPNTAGSGTSLPADITKKIPGLPSASPPSNQKAAPPGAEKRSPTLPLELPKKLLGR